ncbi:MAG: MFS transporter [Erysipelotrichaceae bacterium]|nr:MFS transporter [Erysipelotrichaceae bacterium]
MKKIGKEYIYPVIAGCGLIGTCLGICVNVAGLFFTPIAADLSIGRGSVSMTLTIYNLMQGLIGIIAARYLERYGMKKMVIFSTVLQAGATFLISFCHSIVPMYLLNGIRGFGSGMIGFAAVTMMINFWFNESSALMTSLAMGFSGIAAAVLSPIISSLIDGYGWRFAHMVCAAVILLFNLPAILLPVSLRPKELGLLPYGEEKEKTASETHEYNASFLLIFLATAYGTLNSFVTAMPSHMSGFAQSRDLAQAGAMMVSACMIANTSGKIILGWLMDAVGCQKGASLFIILVTLATMSLYLSDSALILILSAAVFGLSYAVATVSVSAVIRELFGIGLYGKLYPKVSFITTIANALGTSLIGYIYDSASSYDPALLFLAGLLVISFVMLNGAYLLKGKRNS